MFKKLKKKIEEEAGGPSSPGGAASGGESIGPGLASPVSLSGSSPFKRDLDTISVSSETSETVQARSKEDMVKIVMKKNEQVKKLESRISELAVLLKEKTRGMERLEGALEKQQEEHEKQMADLSQQFSAKRAKMKDGFSERREEELKKEVEELKKTQISLEEQLAVSASYRDSLYKQEEENDEMKGLATQELAKVKHMLLIAQEDLEKQRERTQEASAAQQRAEELAEEVASLKTQLTALTKTNEDTEVQVNHLRDEVQDVVSQKQGVERQLVAVQRAAATTRTELSSLQQAYADLEEKHASAERTATQYRNQAQLETSQEEWLEKEIDAEKRITMLEEELVAARGESAAKERESNAAQAALEARMREAVEVRERMRRAEEEAKSQRIIMEQHKADMARAEKLAQKATLEKDSMLLTNASLSQELESERQRNMQQRAAVEASLQQRDTSIAGLECAVEELNTDLNHTRNKLKEMEQQQIQAINEVESAEIDKLRAQIATLDSQLLDKNKTIKTQQQRMTDLKKTLQREFKVQALPNDSMVRGPGLATSTLAKSSSTPQGLNHLPAEAEFVHSSVADNSNNQFSGPATIQAMDISMGMPRLPPGASHVVSDGLGHSKRDKRTRGGDNHKMEYNRDINFEYLRHVVLKFMLSREAEAVHLIKAVSVLLDFTRDEQKLLRDALEYKMSWFGIKAPTLQTGGQTAKVIPPSY